MGGNTLGITQAKVQKPQIQLLRIHTLVQCHNHKFNPYKILRITQDNQKIFG